MNKIYFSSFLERQPDHTLAFADAMQYLRENPGTTFVIEPGVYTLTSNLARETQRAVMNGEYGGNPQRIMFNPKFEYTRGISFAGQNGTRVEGYGVTLMVDGFMEPVSVRDCENVTVCGIRIDHKRKPYSRGIVREVSDVDESGRRECLIEFDADCPIGEATPLFLRFLFFNTDTYENIYVDVKDYSYVDSHHVRFIVENAWKMHYGTEFYTVHTYHSRPAILIENATNIVLEDVTIHSQPGMGVVGNRSENITLHRLSVVPSVGHHLSTNTDGTHFTSIKGLLRIENCVFEGQGDDFVNVHSYYHEIIEKESDTVCYMQEKTPDGTHAQSLDYPDVGDTLELTNRLTMQLVDSFKVTDCVPMADEWKCKVVLDHPLPDDTTDLVLSDVTRLPRLEVVGCTARTHFARSVLIKTRNVLVENCHFFDVIGPAIHIAPEAWWYEGVAPADVTIRGNRIVKCCSRWPDKGAITVMADSNNPQGQCMKNIVIEDNLIDCPTTNYGIFARNVDGLTISRNVVNTRRSQAKIESCINVKSDL